MSYYYQHGYKFSDHGMQRIKQRLGIKEMDDFAAKDYCIKLIDNVGQIYEDNTHTYLQVSGKNLYFVVNKRDNVIVTLTPMSPEKLLSIYENEK